MPRPDGRCRPAVALIGNGSIGRWIAARLSPPPAIVLRGGALPDADLVVEAAGHGALREYGAVALSRGSDLVVASAGALADAALLDRLRSAGSGRVLLPAGAVGGIDALAAARHGGLAAVRYTSRKPPASLSAALPADVETVVFEGNAREAALRFPQNANVAATIALAGIGFEETAVRIVADPTVERNVHMIEAEGAFGALSIRLAGRPLPGNPKSSSLTAMSLYRCIVNRDAAIVI